MVRSPPLLTLSTCVRTSEVDCQLIFAFPPVPRLSRHAPSVPSSRTHVVPVYRQLALKYCVPPVDGVHRPFPVTVPQTNDAWSVVSVEPGTVILPALSIRNGNVCVPEVFCRSMRKKSLCGPRRIRHATFAGSSRVDPVSQLQEMPTDPALLETRAKGLMPTVSASASVDGTATCFVALVGVSVAPVSVHFDFAAATTVGFGSVPVKSPPRAPFHAAYIVS